MTDNYLRIARENLSRVDWRDPAALAERLGAGLEGGVLHFRGFGHEVRLTDDAITLDDRPAEGVWALLISLYALHAAPEPLEIEPLRAFKEFDGSMPYVGAFASHTQEILVPHVADLVRQAETLNATLDGAAPPAGIAGDAALLLRPLPKIALGYVFYLADEDFPASATCLFSANADRFMPTDALADVGEYTSRRMLALIDGA